MKSKIRKKKRWNKVESFENQFTQRAKCNKYEEEYFEKKVNF